MITHLCSNDLQRYPSYTTNTHNVCHNIRNSVYMTVNKFFVGGFCGTNKPFLDVVVLNFILFPFNSTPEKGRNSLVHIEYPYYCQAVYQSFGH